MCIRDRVKVTHCNSSAYKTHSVKPRMPDVSDTSTGSWLLTSVCSASHTTFFSASPLCESLDDVDCDSNCSEPTKCQKNNSSYTIIFKCLFIFSVSKLLLNAPSYDGEIWQADVWRPCPGLLLVFVSIGVVVTKQWHFKQKYLNVNKHFAVLVG